MSSESDNIWTQPVQPPPPLFMGQPERDFVKQINDEAIERVIGQPIAYYAISDEKTYYHPLYGEALQKTTFPPIRVYCLVKWEGFESLTTSKGIDKKPSIIVHFHKRRLTEDQNLFVKEGDFIQYHNIIYEIVKLNEPQIIWGQQEHKMEIEAKCVKARESNFRVMDEIGNK